MRVIVCLSRGPVLTTKPGDTLSHPASSETLRIMRPDPQFHAVSVVSGWLCSWLETSNLTAPVEIPMPSGNGRSCRRWRRCCGRRPRTLPIHRPDGGRQRYKLLGLAGDHDGVGPPSGRILCGHHHLDDGRAHRQRQHAIPINFAVQQQVDCGVRGRPARLRPSRYARHAPQLPVKWKIVGPKAGESGTWPMLKLLSRTLGSDCRSTSTMYSTRALPSCDKTATVMTLTPTTRLT